MDIIIKLAIKGFSWAKGESGGLMPELKKHSAPDFELVLLISRKFCFPGCRTTRIANALAIGCIQVEIFFIFFVTAASRTKTNINGLRYNPVVSTFLCF